MGALRGTEEPVSILRSPVFSRYTPLHRNPLLAPPKLGGWGGGAVAVVPTKDPLTVNCIILTFWSIREVQIHPAHFGAGLTSHAGAAATDARAAADDKGQLQDDLLGAWDTDVDLREQEPEF